MRRMFQWLTTLSVLLGASLGWSQLRVEVSGVGQSQIPIAVLPFKGDDRSPQKMGDIIRSDLERSGQFIGLDTRGMAVDESARPDFSFWKQKSVDVLVHGAVTLAPDGRYDLRYRWWDTVKGVEVGNKVHTVVAADLRLAAHQAADAIFESMTGTKGVFATQIAFVTKNGSRYTLWVADSDGQGAAGALTSQEPIISPNWAPTGRQLAYVSFEGRKPMVYTHRIADGQRRALANFKGSNSAPSWAPDSKHLALTLSKDGGSQIFMLDAGGGNPQRVSQSSSIETDATFSGDGKTLYFVSDKGGAPQIYSVPLIGGTPQRVTFTGNYNISPAPSPDGRFLAYISRVGGNTYRLHLLELATGNAVALTDSSFDERPTFSPNSKMVLYATRMDGKSVLMTTTVDGKVKTQLATVGGEIRDPAWGPWGN